MEAQRTGPSITIGISSKGRATRNVLIDTGAFIALLNAGDDLHADAIAFHRSLPAEVARWTTSSIIGETYTFFRYRIGREAALRWLTYLQAVRGSGHLRIAYADEESSLKAEHLLRRFEDQALSYVDALTLAFAERMNDAAIFGFDHQLALTGLALLPGRRQH